MARVASQNSIACKCCGMLRCGAASSPGGYPASGAASPPAPPSSSQAMFSLLSGLNMEACSNTTTQHSRALLDCTVSQSR